MTDRRIGTLIKGLARNTPELQGFRRYKSTFLIDASNLLIRGLYFQKSWNSNDLFMITAFVDPLVVPFEIINIGHGYRVSRDEKREVWWSCSQDPEEMLEEIQRALRRRALPYLQDATSIGTLLTPCFRERWWDRWNIEGAAGYILALSAAYANDQETFHEVAGIFEALNEGDDRAFVEKERRLLRQVADLLKAPGGAREFLEDLARKRIRVLKLEKHAT